MAVSKQPAITQTSSGEELNEEQPPSRGEAKSKRFHPFRAIRKIFRRRVKRQGTGEGNEASKKSWSTSELQSVYQNPDKYEVLSSPPYKIGLSVSHDSIFSPESSNLPSSEELSRPEGSSLSVQHAGIKNMFKDELFSRIRARRDSDDDDIGLPHSPCTSPTTVDVLNQGLKAKSMKSHTTCSAGSLISMGSSENDEDSGGAMSSSNSSRMSLLERRSLEFEGDPDLSQPVPLNHNAAHHRIAVRPKRTHGLPQKRLKQQLAASILSTLPSTPEVIEDVGKSVMKSEIHESSAITAASIQQSVSRIENELSISQSIAESISRTRDNLEVLQVQTVKQEAFTEHVFSETLHTSEFGVPIVLEKNCFQDFGNLAYNSVALKKEHVSSSAFDSGKNDCKMSLNEKNSMPETIHDKIAPKDCLKFSSKYISSADCSFESSNVRSSKVSKTEAVQHVEENKVQSFESGQEASLQVSALIKNLEQLDNTKFTKENASIPVKLFSAKPEFGITNNKPNGHINDSNVSQNMGTGSAHPNSSKSDTNKVHEKSYDLGPNFQSICLEKPKTRTNISSHQNVESKALADSKAVSATPVVEHDVIQMEIKNQFQCQKNTSGKEQNHHVMPSLFPEEESIMSDKYVIPQAVDPFSNDIDNKISISHHVPNMELTEACNLVTMDNTFRLNSINKINFSSVSSNETIETMQCRDTFMKPTEISLNFLETKQTASNVTVDLVSSNVYRQKPDDKVTISVNSLPDSSVKSEVRKSAESTNIVKGYGSSSSPSNNRKNLRTKPLKQEENKPLPVKDSSSHQPKPTEVHKKVSVEIVPFSQRMKEKKYQPLSHSNSTAQSKHPSGAVVERNLSERRVNKSKETEKTNNRHSFSGSLPAEIERTSLSPSPEKPIVTKGNNKVQYPVQIRIHKNKTYEKENACNDSKSKKEGKGPSTGSEAAGSSLKHHSLPIEKDTKKCETQTKWEIKVQAATPPRNSINYNELGNSVTNAEHSSKLPHSLVHKAGEINSKRTVSPNTRDLREREVSPKPNVDSSGAFKSLDSARKHLKETSSGEPEPELLRVFARRSIKQKPCDKTKPHEQNDEKESSVAQPVKTATPEPTKPKEVEVSVVSASTTSENEVPSVHEELKIVHTSLVKKRSQSFTKKDRPELYVTTPLKEVSVNPQIPLQIKSPDVTASAELENFHRRQRTASEPDVIPVLPPASSLKEQNFNSSNNEKSQSLTFRNENLHRAASLSISATSSLSNGSSEANEIAKGNQNPDVLAGHDGSTPSWLQLAQQRRELREQRERLLLGSSTNSFLDASNKPSRSSKVWDMVNNFQKLQMT